jgi:diguanylate cyclase (GGDEF)-like protein
MHEFALRPTSAFITNNLSADGLSTSKTNAVLVVSAKDAVVTLQTTPLSDGNLLNLSDLAQVRALVVSLVTGTEAKGRCGYTMPQTTLLMFCAHPVSRSNGTGANTAGLVLVRELTESVLLTINKLSQESFALLPPVQPLPVRWALPAFEHWPARSVGVARTDHALTLELDLTGIAGEPLKTVRLPLDRTIVKQGQTAIRQMTLQLGGIALVIGTFLLIVVHYGFVVPLRRLRGGIRTIHENRQWENSVDDTRSDEIGGLAREMNGLLGVIRAQVDALSELSLTDALTGLANRRHFDQRLMEEIHRMKRTGQPLSLLIIDIDHFKKFNDCYGHPAGDVALKQVAQLMHGMTRQSDLPARIGGEEFAVVLFDTSADAAMQFAQKMVQTIHHAQIAHSKSPVSPVLTISVGVVQFRPDQDTKDEFFKHADLALYAAKSEGRNRATLYAPATATAPA